MLASALTWEQQLRLDSLSRPSVPAECPLGITPYYRDSLVTIYHADSNELLPEIPSADLVVADIPYSFGLNSTEEGASWGDLMNASHVYTRWLPEFRRITKASDGAA
jgi:hypothetical protein